MQKCAAASEACSSVVGLDTKTQKQISENKQKTLAKTSLVVAVFVCSRIPLYPYTLIPYYYYLDTLYTAII